MNVEEYKFCKQSSCTLHTRLTITKDGNNNKERREEEEKKTKRGFQQDKKLKMTVFSRFNPH